MICIVMVDVLGEPSFLTSINILYQIARQNRDIERERLQRDSDYNCVLKEISHHNPDSATVQESVQKYAADRASRIDAFLQRLYEKRGSLLEKLIPGSIQCPMISLLS